MGGVPGGGGSWRGRGRLYHFIRMVRLIHEVLGCFLRRKGLFLKGCERICRDNDVRDEIGACVNGEFVSHDSTSN